MRQESRGEKTFGTREETRREGKKNEEKTQWKEKKRRKEKRREGTAERKAHREDIRHTNISCGSRSGTLKRSSRTSCLGKAKGICAKALGVPLRGRLAEAVRNSRSYSD